MGKQKTKQTTKKTVALSKKTKKLAPKKKIAKKPVRPAKPLKSLPKTASDSAPVSVPKPKILKQKKAPVSSGPKGYTASEYSKFKEYKEKFEGYSNQALKDLLRKNLQSMSGNKDELVLKCADGATLGQIPRCPKCYGGRPKFDFKKGTYHCSGYRDDTDFHNCHTDFTKQEITRNSWEH